MEDLRDKRARLWEEMKALLDRAEKEDRNLEPTEKDSYDKMEAELESLDERVERTEKAEERDKVYGEPTTKPVEPDLEAASDSEEPDLCAQRKDWIFHNKRAENRDMSWSNNAYPDMVEGRALQGDLDPGGGYLIPDQQFITSILKGVEDESFMRRLAKVYTLGRAEALALPRRGTALEDATWKGEITQIDEDTALDFDLITIKPQKTAKLLRISRDLLDDTPTNIEEFVQQEFSYKFGITEEQSFITGVGVMEPLGCMVASGMGISTSRDYSTGNTITTVVPDNLIGNITNIKLPYRKNSTWLLHRTTIRAFRQFKDGNGQYMWQPGLALGQPNTLLDRPVFESEFMPNTFTTGLYVGIVGDFKRGYAIVDKMGMTMQRLLEIYFRTDQIGLAARMRVGGAPVIEEAFSRVTIG